MTINIHGAKKFEILKVRYIGTKIGYTVLIQ